MKSLIKVIFNINLLYFTFTSPIFSQNELIIFNKKRGASQCYKIGNPKKESDEKHFVEFLCEGEVKLLNNSNQEVLSYIPTPKNNGLKLKLSKKYNIHLTKDKKEKLERVIISDADRLLRGNKKIEQTLENSSIITPEWFERQMQTNPLFLLNECDECSLARFKTTSRVDCENKIVETIKNNFKNYNNAKDVLNYTSFACGHFFQDLVIITKLIAQGFKKINVNLIDTNFNEYIDILKKRGKSISLNIFDKERNDRGYWLRAHTYRFAQILEWFENEPGVSINIYGSVNSYIKECSKNSDMKSDIIVGIDYTIDGDGINNLKTMCDFAQLEKSALKPNGYRFSLTS